MLLKVPEEKIVYSKEPENSIEYTNKLDKGYSTYAKVYDVAVKLLPVWKTWIKTVIPHIEGNRVLEASFGTGYLLMQYANNYETYGIDFNNNMLEVAQKNLSQKAFRQRFNGLMSKNFLFWRIILTRSLTLWLLRDIQMGNRPCQNFIEY